MVVQLRRTRTTNNSCNVYVSLVGKREGAKVLQKGFGNQATS